MRDNLCNMLSALLFWYTQTKQETSPQPYVEMWTIEVCMGWKKTHMLILRFFFSYPDMFFISCNFWLIFKHIPTKSFVFCFLTNPIYVIGNFKGQLLKITLPEKPLPVLYINGHILHAKVWTWFLYLNKTKSVLIIPKSHLFPVLRECITLVFSKINKRINKVSVLFNLTKLLFPWISK